MAYLSYLTMCARPDIAIGSFGIKAGDTNSYIQPIDNYITKGEYFSDYHNNEKIHAGRLPHYGILYYLFRFSFLPSVSYDLIVIFQVLIESISIVIFSICIYRVIGSIFSFWIGYLLMIISLNSSIYNFTILPESLGISFLCIMLFFYQKYLIYKKNNDLFLSGLFLAIVVVLKPYFILFYIPIGLNFLWPGKNPEGFFFYLTSIVKRTILVSITLLLLLLPWTIRNYSIYKKVVPLQVYTSSGYTPAYYSKADNACFKFLKAWGGSIHYWDENAAGCYFMPKENITCNFFLPDHAIAAGYSRSDVDKVRNDYVQLQKGHNDSLDKKVAEEFDRLTELYIRNKPFNYYFLAPLILVKAFLLHNGTYYLPIASRFPCYENYQMLIKVSQFVLYWITLIIGLYGLFLLSVNNKNNIIFIFIPMYLILMFPVYDRDTEWRFFAPSYPVLILGTCYLIHRVLQKLFDPQKYRHPNV